MARPGPDHHQIELMIDAGFTPAQIAARLECSERTVRRVIDARGLTVDPNPLIGTQDEHVLWLAYHALHEPVALVATRFGRSRQHVHNVIHQHELAL